MKVLFYKITSQTAVQRGKVVGMKPLGVSDFPADISALELSQAVRVSYQQEETWEWSISWCVLPEEQEITL